MARRRLTLPEGGVAIRRLRAIHFPMSEANPTWSVKDKNCIVTGATSGIGEATARGLLNAGASVTMVVRSAEKAQRTATSLRNETGNQAIDFVLCDFASFASIRTAAAEILEHAQARGLACAGRARQDKHQAPALAAVLRMSAIRHLLPAP